ncbi:MAG: TolC family protein, partial [Candidatus Aminicenantes bacterium]|nr:TolC family protein [Candidatus Aminicenantes bacterium]
MFGKSYKVFSVTPIVLVILLIPFSLHPNINNNLTLNAVLVKVLGGNPDLAAMRYEVKSKDGEIYQQSRLANPEFEFELENFAGSGELSGFGRSEYTALLSQEIPTGNKRSLSVRIAKVEKTISELMINKKGADLLLEAKKKFYELYFLQEKIALKRKQISHIENFKLQILKRVRAGKTSPLELSRIKIYLLRCKTDLKSAVSEFYSTGVYLASLWGEDSFSYKSVIAEYSEWE